MPQHPLLVFPEPVNAEKARRFGGGSSPRIPGAGRQAERLTPQFQRLQQAMERQRIVLQDNAFGLLPEQVLVIETIGPVQNFINVVQRIDGLEWLGEIDLEDIPPEHGFEDEQDPEKPLKGHLFLIMTDQSALQQMLGLFTSWKRDSEVRFPRGLAPLKQAFTHLHTIRPWDAKDRIRDTGIIEDWQIRISHGQDVVPFEAELWFRADSNRQQQSQFYLGSVIDSLGGEIVKQCIIPQISYHGVLGKIPSGDLPELLSEMESLQNFRLLKCEDIMHIRPIGQCGIRLGDDLSDAVGLAEEGEGEPPFLEGDPLVALLDGLPLAGHRLLSGRIVVDDPDDYERNYQAKERLHGTVMASLICHGDLNSGDRPLTRPLYARPIMQPKRGFDGRFCEAIPDTVLPVDLVHRAVRRLYESEGGEPPAAPSVRVINLSVCDRYRPFDRSMSSWARLLDWLSWKYNVLFVVSAGNHTHDIELAVPRTELRDLDAETLEKEVIKAIAADTRHRRLLCPSETINSITLASTHEDASGAGTNPSLIDPFTGFGLPSTTSAQGPGYQRTIKPDIFLPGGKQLLMEKMGTAHPNGILQTTYFNSPPGQRVAAPGPAGELDRTIHTRGSSNAAALASRWAEDLFDIIQQLRASSGTRLPAEYDVVLLKTLLIHGADWDDAGEIYTSILRNDQNSRTFKDYVGRFLGYGLADVGKVMACTDQRATVLGVGKLEDGEGHVFLLPLPPSLSAVTKKRRLTITLAWMTPVNSRRQSYRIAHLWFDPKNDLAPSRICADHRAAQRGTIQHEVLEGARAIDFQDGETIAIKVSCRADAGDIPEPIRYGLAVTLEVAEGIDIPIYQEIKERLRVPVPVQSGGRA